MTVRRVLISLLLSVQAWACASAQTATPVLGGHVPGTTPNTNRSTVSVKTPSYSVFANALNDPAIVTWAAYGANSVAWTSATQFVTAAGASHHAAEFNWDELEPTQGNYTWTLLDRFVRDTGTLPLIIKISPIGSDGTRHTPSDLNGLAYSSTTLSNAYNTMLDTLAPRLNHRLWILAIGNEMDTYFATHTSLISAYATFLSRTAPHARTVFGTQPFKVTACFTSAVLTSWSTYAAISAQLDLNYFSYFVGGSSNLPVDFGNMGTHGLFVLDFGAPSNTPVLGSSETLQALLVQAMIGYAAGTGKLVAASYFQLAEISTAVLASFGSTTPALELVQSLGLIDLSGNPKPGWQIMLEVLQGQVTPPPPTLNVNRPSWSIVANPANDPAIVTATAYLANTTGKIAAQAKAITVGADHLQEVLKWSDVEPTTVGVYDFSLVDTFVNNSGTLPLILNIAPIWDNGTKSVPTALAATAWDSNTMSNAYVNMLTALASHLKGRLWILGVGNEIDIYLSAHPTEIPQFATFLSRLRTPARRLYGVNPFSITTTFRSTAVDQWSDYTSILLFTDLESFTYYPVADSNLSTTVVADITHLFGIVGNGPVMFQEVGLSSAGSSSEAIQAQGVALVFTALSNYANQGNNIVAVTWASLEDLSASVILSFGYSSGQLTNALGVRDTSDAPKQAFGLLCDYLGGTNCHAAPPPTCTYSLSKTSDMFTSAAGSGSFTITTGASCAWTLSAIGGTPAWLTIGPASGTGTTTINYSVLVNTDTTGRSATVVIGYTGGSQTFSVSQDGAQPPPPPPTCTFTVNKTSDAFTNASGSNTLTLTAVDATCAWTAAVLGGINWLTLDALGGSGNHTTTYSVSANGGTPTRTGQFTIGGNLITISQAGTQAPPPNPDPDPAPVCTSTTASPTGRTPLFGWTACRQDTWNREYADYLSNPATPPTLGGRTFKRMKEQADCSCRNYDVGQYDAWVYQVTGDATYATRSYNKLYAWFTTPHTYGKDAHDPDCYFNCEITNWQPNTTREEGTFWSWIIDWLTPAITTQQADTMISKFADNFEVAIGIGNHGALYYARIGDSDQSLGVYFGIVELHLLRPNDARVTTLYNYAGGTSVFGPYGAGVGGLVPAHPVTDLHTDSEATLREVVQYYVKRHAEGGEWIESSDEYNSGTLNFLMQGYDFIKTATGTDYFPEIAEYLPKLGERNLAAMTPDLKFPLQWGDNECSHRFCMWLDGPMFMRTAGILDGRAIGRRMQGLVLDLIALYGLEGFPSLETSSNPNAAMVAVFFDPYQPADDWKVKKSYIARGVGLGVERSGFGPTDSMFVTMYDRESMSTTGPDPYYSTLVDHYSFTMGDIRLWKNHEWVLDHPITYANTSIFGEGVNGPMMWGLGGMLEYKADNIVSNADDNHLYMAGTTGGTSIYGTLLQGDDLPYVHEWTRSVVDLPGATDTIIVHDRANVLTSFTATERAKYSTDAGYFGPNQVMFDAMPRSKAVVFHTPVAPTVTGNVTSWATAGGQNVKITTLSPSLMSSTIYDENNMPAGQCATWYGCLAYTGLTGYEPYDKKFHIKIYPSTDAQFVTFLHVIQVGTAGSVTLKTDTGTIQGAHVTRPAQSDVLALFNAAQASDLTYVSHDFPNHATALAVAHWRGIGTTAPISWTAVASSTQVYIHDLDPNATWTVNIDGAGSVAMSPCTASTTTTCLDRASGEYNTTVSGSGGHTISFIGSGAAPPPPSCSVTITLSPSSLTDGVVGTAYSQTVSAAGGTAPYTYSVQSGTLPTGLSLNAGSGAITGTPTVGGTYSFTIKAAQVDGCFGNKSYQIVIAAESTVDISRTGTPEAFSDVGGSASSITRTVTMGTGTNRLALVELIGSTTDTFTGCTFNGNAFTLITKVHVPGDLYLYALQLVAPTLGAHALTCTFSAATVMAGVFHGYKGVNQTTPIGVIANAYTSSNSNAVHTELTPTTANTWTVMADRAYYTPTPGVGSQTVLIPPGVSMGVFDAGPHVTPNLLRAMEAALPAPGPVGAIMFAINPVVVP